MKTARGKVTGYRFQVTGVIPAYHNGINSLYPLKRQDRVEKAGIQFLLPPPARGQTCNLQHKRTGAFTLVEILIACTILMVGLLGIFAVFPAAQRSLRSAERDTYAAIITESIKACIEIGMRRMKYTDEAGGEFFLYAGPGVSKSDVTPTGGVEFHATNRIKTERFRNFDSFIRLPMKLGAEYLYPKPLKVGLKGAGGRSEDGYIETARVFRIGADIAQVVREADKGERDSNTREVWEADQDPYRHYSYCFTIRRVAAAKSATQLYYVTVYIYRNFPIRLAAENRKAAREKPGYRPVSSFGFYMTP